ERRDARDSFAGHQMNTAWDALHRAYFIGEALWTYLTTPFLLAMDGVAVEETELWSEGEEAWRVLRAHFPGLIETHSLIQDFFFDESRTAAMTSFMVCSPPCSDCPAGSARPYPDRHCASGYHSCP